MGTITAKDFIKEIPLSPFPYRLLVSAVPTLSANDVHFRCYRQWYCAIADFSGPAFK
jgi:hypothetical protein